MSEVGAMKLVFLGGLILIGAAALLLSALATAVTSRAAARLAAWRERCAATEAPEAALRNGTGRGRRMAATRAR